MWANDESDARDTITMYCSVQQDVVLVYVKNWTHRTNRLHGMTSSMEMQLLHSSEMRESEFERGRSSSIYCTVHSFMHRINWRHFSPCSKCLLSSPKRRDSFLPFDFDREISQTISNHKWSAYR